MVTNETLLQFLNIPPESDKDETGGNDFEQDFTALSVQIENWHQGH